jgi:tetratricopeptide (TPR) repeat protein
MDEAREAYLAAIQRFDSRHDDSAIRQAMREARLALSHIELARDDFPAAAEWLEQVLDEFPEDPSANNDLGYLWTDRGLHLHRGLAMVQRAVATDPGNLSYRDSLGWALFRLGQHAAAEKELATAAAGDESGVVLDHWGDVLSKLGRKDEALSAWRRAEAAFQKTSQTKELEAVRKKIAAAE